MAFRIFSIIKKSRLTFFVSIIMLLLIYSKSLSAINPGNPTTTDDGTTNIVSTTIQPTTTDAPMTTTDVPMTTTDAPIIVQKVNEANKDTIRKTNAGYGYFDEECQMTKGQQPKPVSNANATKFCDPQSFLECFESVRHDFTLICQCQAGAVKNPYDINRCIPDQNYKRKHGESCKDEDNEICDTDGFLRCNTYIHRCECVDDLYIGEKTINVDGGKTQKICALVYDKYKDDLSRGSNKYFGHSTILIGLLALIWIN